jgi:ribonuclease E
MAGDMPPPEQDFAQPHPTGSEAHGNGRGDGEPRRRRRGRRGGRRSRRDRDGNGDFAASQGHETHERRDFNERPEWSPPREVPQADTLSALPHPVEPAPRPEPAQPAATSAEPPPAAEREPQRRRSTVREPAPVFTGGAPVMPPMPAPIPAATPIVTSTADGDTAKPKRSGWWAKRLLGG